jgi:hypothetical protein
MQLYHLLLKRQDNNSEQSRLALEMRDCFVRRTGSNLGGDRSGCRNYTAGAPEISHAGLKRKTGATDRLWPLPSMSPVTCSRPPPVSAFSHLICLACGPWWHNHMELQRPHMAMTRHTLGLIKYSNQPTIQTAVSNISLFLK